SSQGRPARLSRLTLFSRSHACADGEPREIAIVGHAGIGRVPKFRLDGLQLCQDGGAVRIIGRDPVGGFEIGSVISILLSLVTVHRLLLSRRREFGFCSAFLRSEEHTSELQSRSDLV